MTHSARSACINKKIKGIALYELSGTNSSSQQREESRKVANRAAISDTRQGVKQGFDANLIGDSSCSSDENKHWRVSHCLHVSCSLVLISRFASTHKMSSVLSPSSSHAIVNLYGYPTSLLLISRLMEQRIRWESMQRETRGNGGRMRQQSTNDEKKLRVETPSSLGRCQV